MKMGVRVPPPTDNPEDPYTKYRKEVRIVDLLVHMTTYSYYFHLQCIASMQPLRPYERQDTLQQFLDHDREVLRFYCFWDDSDRYRNASILGSRAT